MNHGLAFGVQIPSHVQDHSIVRRRQVYGVRVQSTTIGPLSRSLCWTPFASTPLKSKERVSTYTGSSGFTHSRAGADGCTWEMGWCHLDEWIGCWNMGHRREERVARWGEWVKGDGRLVRRTITDDSVPVISRCRGVEIGTGVKPL